MAKFCQIRLHCPWVMWSAYRCMGLKVWSQFYTNNIIQVLLGYGPLYPLFWWYTM